MSMRAILANLGVALAAAVCPGPIVAAAQAVDPPASGPVLTVDQVRDAFSRAGFQVEPAYTWAWTVPTVTTFRIRDRGSARVLMALIYPNMAAAQAERLQAQAQEQAQNPGSATNAHSLHLVAGYGASVWNGNVALVQTLQSDLDRVFQLQSDQDNCVDSVDPNVARAMDPPSYAVDSDFQQALYSSVSDL